MEFHSRLKQNMKTESRHRLQFWRKRATLIWMFLLIIQQEKSARKPVWIRYLVWELYSLYWFSFHYLFICLDTFRDFRRSWQIKIRKWKKKESTCTGSSSTGSCSRRWCRTCSSNRSSSGNRGTTDGFVVHSIKKKIKQMELIRRIIRWKTIQSQ